MNTNFDSTDLNECKFIWRRLGLKKFGSEEPKTIDGYASKINEYFQNERFKSVFDKMAAISDLKNNYSSEQIIKRIKVTNDLAWVDINDHRLCFWLWKTIQGLSIDFDQLEGNYERGITPYYNGPLSYNSLNLPNDTFATDQRYAFILRFFDAWEIHLGEKEKTIIELQKRWQETLSVESFQWILKKDKNQISKEDWFCNYMANKLPQITTWTGQIPTAITLTERLIIAIGYFDLWPASHPAEKKLFIQNMKKAWAQKKHRDKMQGRKAYSMVMGTDIKAKLDSMAVDSHMHRNELLEEMIKYCHEQCNKGLLKFSKW